MPNQREIARHLGLAQATVARALQGSNLVTEETRRRVNQAARDLGYRPNYLVSALMEHIRSGKKVRDVGSIAILADAASERECHWDRIYQLHYEGFLLQAAKRGFRTERFWIKGPGMTNQILDRMLYTRGFCGVLFAGPEGPVKNSVILKWERYAVGAVGYGWQHVPSDRTSSDHRFNAMHAFDMALKRGYQRIGLVLPPSAFNSVDSGWLSGYLCRQYYTPPRHQIPIFAGSIHTCGCGDFRRWFNQWKPEAILCLMGEEMVWLKELGLLPGRDIGLACLNRPADSGLSGIDENAIDVARWACDIVINHVLHNERGLSENPRMVMIKGTWMEGDTLPVNIQAAGRSRGKVGRRRRRS